MSRIGKKPIVVPEKVEVEIKSGKVVVSGPKGALEVVAPRRIKVEKKGGQILVNRLSDEKKVKAMHGTIRQLIANALLGVTKGWERSLVVVGTGYRVAMEGNELVLSIGFSHQPKLIAPEGIKIEVKDQDKILVHGVDKALVGRVAASIRAIRPPDVYKGKGIRYAGEEIKLKPGKAAQTGAARAVEN